jgi:archaellum biogenesis ATPase FlaH
LNIDEKTSLEWVINHTEKWCQDRAMYLALTKSIQICDGKDKVLDKGAIPSILSEALAISFDSHIGHDFFDDADKRFDFYHHEEHKIPFELDMLNTITRGGLPKKSIAILMAGVNVGKTLMMCGFAAHNLSEGKNVLYITMEMSEEMISQRIEANMMDLTIDQVSSLEKIVFDRNIAAIKKNTVGRLKVKEYPTSQAGSANFRYLLNELKLKSNFVPDIIYIDYLNICMSSRLKYGKASLYEYIKAVGEEIRGLAVEFNVPIITATQFNRAGFKSSDPGMEDVSESFGTNATADLILSIVRTDEMDKLNQLMVTQLKNRFSNKSENRKFIIGVNVSKMKLYNVEDKEQTLLKDENDDNLFFTPDVKKSLDMSGNPFEDFS